MRGIYLCYRKIIPTHSINQLKRRRFLAKIRINLFAAIRLPLSRKDFQEICVFPAPAEVRLRTNPINVNHLKSNKYA